MPTQSIVLYAENRGVRSPGTEAGAHEPSDVYAHLHVSFSSFLSKTNLALLLLPQHIMLCVLIGGTAATK